jgi:hypothetical protein
MLRFWLAFCFFRGSLATSWPLRDCSQIIPPPQQTQHPSADAAQHDAASSASNRMASIVQHKSLHQKARFWGQREPFFVGNIPNGSVVADLGCGAMHLRSALESSHHTGVHYIPVDAVHRGDAAMRLCNLNKHEYPLNLHPTPTVVVVQGLFEYIYDKLLFLRVLRCAYPRATLLLSYAVGHRVGAYKAQGWVAPLLPEQLNEIFGVLQLNVTHRVPNCFPDQACLRLVSASTRPPPAMCAGSARARQQLLPAGLKEDREAAAGGSGGGGGASAGTNQAERDGGGPHKRGAGAGGGGGARSGHGLGKNSA